MAVDSLPAPPLRLAVALVGGNGFRLRQRPWAHARGIFQAIHHHLRRPHYSLKKIIIRLRTAPHLVKARKCLHLLVLTPRRHQTLKNTNPTRKHQLTDCRCRYIHIYIIMIKNIYYISQTEICGVVQMMRY